MGYVVNYLQDGVKAEVICNSGVEAFITALKVQNFAEVLGVNNLITVKI